MSKFHYLGVPYRKTGYGKHVLYGKIKIHTKNSSTGKPFFFVNLSNKILKPQGISTQI